MQISSLGQEDPLEEGMPPRSPASSVLAREGAGCGSVSPGGGHATPLQYFAWKIPRSEEPCGLQSVGS